MPELNASIPHLPCYVRREFLCAFQEGFGELEHGICHLVTSIPGRALGFWVLMDNGALIGRLPIHALKLEPTAPDVCWRQPWRLQLWNCFSSWITVTEMDWLCSARVRACMSDGALQGGRYLFTIDYWNSTLAEAAGDTGWKCHHILALDNGLLAALPNNRLCWFEPATVTPFDNPPSYRTMPHTWNVEDGGEWRTSDDDRMFYEIVRSHP